jgi:hypothetical protein
LKRLTLEFSGTKKIRWHDGLSVMHSKAAPIKMTHLEEGQVHAIQTAGIDSNHVITRRGDTFAIGRTPALGTIAVLDGVLVESVCTHAVFGREQTKIFAGNKPVKRTVFAAD